MYTTSIPGVLISREAMDLAYAVACEIDRLLTQIACEQVKAAETWEHVNVAGNRVVSPREIEAAVRVLSVDLVALLATARDKLHAGQEARRVA